jgi:hypothetical protein
MRSVLLLIVFLPFVGISQSKERVRRLASIGITVAPEYNYRVLNFSHDNQWLANMRDDEEVANTGLTIGIQPHFRMGKKMRLETGVLYSNKGLKTKWVDLAWVTDDAGLPAESKIVYRYKYLIIPMNVSYSIFEDEKVRLFASMGMSMNIFLQKKTKVIFENSSSSNDSHESFKQTGYSHLNFAARMGAGIDYRLSSRLNFRAEPYFQRSITSIVVDKGAKEYLFSFGLALGVHYLL